MLLNKFTKGVRETKKQISAATTILGPDGVSQVSELSSPAMTESTPMTEATISIWAGLVANRREAAAGIIKSEVINRTPTIFIEIAITAAISIMNISSVRLGSRPSASANS